MDKCEFGKLVVEALDILPLQFRRKLENVEIVVEESMPQDLTKICPHRPRRNVGRGRRGRTVLLGLYRGIPLKKRGIWYHAALPDKITIYKNTIEGMCRNENEIRRRIRDVLYHEIGHHFGLTEEQLR